VFAGCDDPRLGIYAATDSDGSLAVILINLSSEDVIRPVLVDVEDHDADFGLGV
jgi:hypothetical protein